MRRPRSYLTVLACVGAAVAAAPAHAADPVVAPPLPPEAVPAAVAEAVNALSPTVSPCSLMTRDLRAQVAIRELMTHEPAANDPWAPDDVTRMCDAYVLRDVGFGTDTFPNRGGWLRTDVGPARVVQARADVVQLRARVWQRYAPADEVFASEEVVDLFVVREEGVWRLASSRGLLEVDLSDGGPAKTLAELARERSEQNRLTRRLLRARARMVRELATLPRPFARRETMRCGTGAGAVESGRSEPTSRGRSGPHRTSLGSRPVHGPRAARADMVDARLSSGQGRLCWTIRFRGRAADQLDIGLLLAQEGAPTDDDGRTGDWILRLRGGSAVGLREAGFGVARVFAVRASVRGRVVRVVVPARRVRGQVRVGRPFGWSVISYTPAPDRPPGSTVRWVDTMPALNTWDDLAGIKHGPADR